MLSDLKKLGKKIQFRFQENKSWPEIKFTDNDKKALKEIGYFDEVYESSLRPHTAILHCYIPSQYILYAVCIKEFALKLKEYMDIFDMIKEEHGTNGTCSLITNVDLTQEPIASLDEYSKNIVLTPFVDKEYRFGAKTIINGSSPTDWKLRSVKDFYGSVILKIINVPDVSSNILGDLIYEITKHREQYVYFEKQYLKYLPYICKNNVINDFVKEVIEFLYQYDGLSNIKRFIEQNDDERNYSIKNGPDTLTSIFRVSKTLLNREDLVLGGKPRYFEDPLFMDDLAYYYLSTEWTNDKDSCLDLQNLKQIIERNYKEFQIEIIDDNYIFNCTNALKKTCPTERVDFDISEIQKCISTANLKFDDSLIVRFVSALCSKPFVLLSGLSGSGKTLLARAFASWISSEGLNEHQIHTTVTYTEKSIENSFGWTLKKDVIDKLINQEDQYIEASVAGIDATKCKLEYKNIFYYKTDEKKDEISKTIKENYKINDEIPLTIKLNKEFSTTHSHSYCLLPVGADWTNREPLLGYPDALNAGKYVKPDNGVLDLLINANDNSDLPFFLILDEMNLSHVERYFAEFLSAMESGLPIPLHSYDRGMTAQDGTVVPAMISLPENLFIIGTVNIDETTYMFSPKVLDRAGVIEFRTTDDELIEFLDNPVKPDMTTISAKGASMAYDFLQKAKAKETAFEDKDVIIEVLKDFFTELKKVGAEFGYRTASEIFRYAAKVRLLGKDSTGKKWSAEQIIDTAIMQKLLPKLHGSRKKLEPILTKLAELCLKKNVENIAELLREFEGSPEKIEGNKNVKFKVSLEKILRMRKRVVQDGFTSFAEA